MSTKTITKEMIETAINRGILYPRCENNSTQGVVACVRAPIDDIEFYCTGMTGEDMSVVEYLQNCGIDTFISDVYEALNDSSFKNDFPEEFELYYSLFN